MNKTDDKICVNVSTLSELVDFAIENERCPSGTEWLDVTRMSDDCPGFVSGISCQDCWLDHLDADM